MHFVYCCGLPAGAAEVQLISGAAQVSGAKQVVAQLSGANGFCGRFRVSMVPGLHYGFHTDLVGELAKFDKVTYKGGQVML